MPSGGARQGAGRPRKMIGIEAGRSVLSPGQMALFESSPYVSKVTAKTVSFTGEFKEMFWQRFNNGAAPEQIFYEAGIDPDVIGVSRIWGLISSLRRQKKLGLEFNDGQPRYSEETQMKRNMPKQGRYPITPKDQAMNEAEIAKLKHAVAYLTQELEFIKKIILAANGGRSK